MRTREELARAAWVRHRRPYKVATSRTPSKWEAIGSGQRDFCRDAVDRHTRAISWWVPARFIEHAIIWSIVSELEAGELETWEDELHG